MAENFKNFKLELTETPAVAYTCPAGKVAIVIGLQAANSDGTYEGDLTLGWTDASDSGAETNLLFAVVVPPGSAMNCLAGKLALEAGDEIVAEASADETIVLTGTVVEMDA
jgi:hypothetical protein